MSFDADKLYNLLPAIYRIRDADQGYPLRQFIEVIADQVAVLDENLNQLYDNQFVETATPWALPYIGDVLGIRGLSAGGLMARSPRAEVGHTVAYRRRKGTAAILELLARDVTGWPARAVEFFQRLAATQNWNHLRLECRGFASLRDAATLEFFNTPFEQAMRTVEVRRIEPGLGKWNIPNVGIFLYRLHAYPLTRSPLAAAKINDVDSNTHFRFHPLGLDAPLFSQPETEDEITHLAEPINVPMPITRRMLCGDPFLTDPKQFYPSADYYGPGQSLLLERQTDGGLQEIAAAGILVADLGDVKNGAGNVTSWAHETFDQNMVLLDPQRGRVVFSEEQDPDRPPLASFHYGFSSDMGGGEYERLNSFLMRVPRLSAAVPNVTTNQNSFDSLDEALNAVIPTLSSAEPKTGLVEITDSGRYELTLQTLDVADGQLELRAANGKRPHLVLKNPLTITGNADAQVTLNGLLISNGTLTVNGELGWLRLRHCTLVPATTGSSQSLIVDSPGVAVEIDHCIIVGGLGVNEDARVSITNSIVDALEETKAAFAAPNGTSAGGALSIENSTVIGAVNVRVLGLASNTIFFGDSVNAQRHQQGCVRFCWLPANSHVPRRYRCLPTAAAPDVRPVFTSRRFGDPAYGQLSQSCPEAIRTGADDKSEMGAFHDLFQPQREAYLRGRLAEYLRFGLEAGVFYAT
ncbi:MAG: hypothetical protein WBW16_14260 [Bacteroidota bacterium]